MDLQGISDLKHVDKFVGMKLKDASRPSILAVFRRFVDSDDGQTSEWPNAEKNGPNNLTNVAQPGWIFGQNFAQRLQKLIKIISKKETLWVVVVGSSVTAKEFKTKGHFS